MQKILWSFANEYQEFRFVFGVTQNDKNEIKYLCITIKCYASQLVPSITSFYLPIEKTIEEPKEVLLAPAIPGTLKFHKIIRKYNIRNICYLEFFNRSYRGIPTFKQFDRKDDDSGICDHMYVDVDNHTYCLNPYWKFETQ